MEFSALRTFRTQDLSFTEITERLMPPPADVAQMQATVDGIIARVRAEGDDALLDYTRRFDWPEATLEGLRVSEQEMDEALAAMDGDLLQAMTMAAEHIRRFHQRQMPADWLEDMEFGLSLGMRHTPVDSVACYVPTRKASLPSSVLMSVVPAQVARVPRIIVVGPARADGTMPEGVLAAAHLLGITEIYKIGGAQAMAALAYGTPNVPKVDLIVGPTNAYGMLAKKTVFGDVGIDGLYGPSDVTILADGTVPAAWIATDMLSQAEHGEDSQAVLITPHVAYATEVAQEVTTQLERSPRAQYLRVALQTRSAIILTRDMAEAAAMSNALAPEHLELAVADPQALLPSIRHAGAIFMGGYAPVPVGDYYAGPSHVLPTDRTARFSSGLGVMTFLKRSSLIQVGPNWLTQHSDTIAALADHEGLPAHAEAVRIRK